MAGRTIAIGDIHGCALALQRLLEEISPSSSDTVVTLGDYIDRGPDSRKVLNRLIRLAEECKLVSLLGNHEIMLLAARENPQELGFWLSCGGRETLASYGGGLDAIPRAHFQFLEACVPTYESASHFFVHANYDPGLPLDHQSDYVLFWKHLTTEIPEPHMSGKVAVVGHTPQATGQILDKGHLICLDTFCCGGGPLTALEVDTREYWQADLEGNFIRGISDHH